MLTYTVHEPPNPPAGHRPGQPCLHQGLFKLGREALRALLGAHLAHCPPAVEKSLLGFVVLIVGFELVKRMTGVDQRWVGLAGWALALMIVFEGDTLRRWALERRGWRMLGSVTGKTAAECERRFFETWLPDQPITSPRADPPAAGPGGASAA